MGLSSGLVCGRGAYRGLLLSVTVAAVLGLWEVGRVQAMGAAQQAPGALSASQGRLVADLSRPGAMTYELANGHMRTVISARAMSTASDQAGSGEDMLSAPVIPMAQVEESAPEAATGACTLNQATPTTSACAGETIEAGWKEVVNGSGNGVHALVEFAVPNLGSAIVLNSKLELYEKSATTKTKVAMSVYRVTTPWASGTTWSTPWKKQGGDFEEATESSVTDENVGEKKGVKTWYPTRMVQSWINGVSAPRNEGSENLGLLVKDDPESEGESNVVTFDGPAAETKYPSLTIEWVPRGIGASPRYTLLPVASSASTAEKVNPASGDLIATSKDLTIEANGFPFHVERTYNSLAPSEPGYGKGWTDENTEHLRIEPGSSVEYTDPTGATFEFVRAGGGLATPPELEKEVVICVPGKEVTSGGYHCSELPTGDSYAVIYVKTGLAYYFAGNEGTLYPISVDTPSAEETAHYTTGYTLPTSWTDDAKATIDYEESKTKGYTGVTFPAEGEEVKYVEKKNNKAYKLVEFTSEQDKITKYVYGTGTQEELLTEIVEPSGATIKIAYNSANQVSSIENIAAGQKSGPVTTFTYYAAGSAPLPCLTIQRATIVSETGGSGNPSVTYCSNVLDEVEPGTIGHSGTVEPDSICTLWSTEPETTECKAEPPIVGYGQPPSNEKATGENTKASGDFRYLAQFPTNRATPPLGVRVISATYTQEVSAATNTKAPFSLGLYGVTTEWSGSAAWPESATWTHASSVTAWAPGGEFSGNGASTIAEAGSKTGKLTWNVTEIVQEWSDDSAIVPGRGDYGFALLNNESAPQKENVLSLGAGYLEFEYEVYEQQPTTPTYLNATYEESSGDTDVSWAASTTPPYPGGYPGPGISYYEYRYALNGGGWSRAYQTDATEFSLEGTSSGEKIEVEVKPFTYHDISGQAATASLTSSPPTLSAEDPGGMLAGEEGEYYEMAIEGEEEELDPKLPYKEILCPKSKNACGTFDYSAAVAFAKRWALPGYTENQMQGFHDLEFPFFNGNDCADFASQALHAGGMQFMRSHDDDNPEGYEYEKSFLYGEGAWWAYWTPVTFEGGIQPPPRKYEYSRTWSLAGELEKHLVEFGLGRVIKDGEPVRPGDLVFYDQTNPSLEPGKLDHTQIVIAANHSYVLIAQHSPSTEKTLANAIADVDHYHGTEHTHWNFEIVEPTHTKANIPLGSE